MWRPGWPGRCSVSPVVCVVDTLSRGPASLLSDGTIAVTAGRSSLACARQRRSGALIVSRYPGTRSVGCSPSSARHRGRAAGRRVQPTAVVDGHGPGLAGRRAWPGGSPRSSGGPVALSGRRSCSCSRRTGTSFRGDGATSGCRRARSVAVRRRHGQLRRPTTSPGVATGRTLGAVAVTFISVGVRAIAIALFSSAGLHGRPAAPCRGRGTGNSCAGSWSRSRHWRPAW